MQANVAAHDLNGQDECDRGYSTCHESQLQASTQLLIPKAIFLESVIPACTNSRANKGDRETIMRIESFAQCSGKFATLPERSPVSEDSLTCPSFFLRRSSVHWNCKLCRIFDIIKCATVLDCRYSASSVRRHRAVLSCFR